MSRRADDLAGSTVKEEARRLVERLPDDMT
jgi:hypothetical protein